MKTNGINIRHIGLVLVAATAASMMLVGGCDTGNTELLGSASKMIPDIPLPTKFDLDEEHSRMWTDGTLRYADMLYEGSADMASVQKFYNQQMPISHWIAQSEQYSQGRATLDYVKNAEKCRITIYTQGMMGHTFVHVVIWPNRPNAKIEPK